MGDQQSSHTHPPNCIHLETLMIRQGLGAGAWEGAALTSGKVLGKLVPFGGKSLTLYHIDW